MTDRRYTMPRELSPKPRGLAPRISRGHPDQRKEPEVRIAGQQAVSALLRHDPARVLRFFYTEARAQEVGKYCRDLAQRRLPYRMVPEDELEKIYGSPHHGGVVAITRPQVEHTLTRETLLALKQQGSFHFVLDGIGNPHNIGAIARSLAFFGFKSLILSDDPRQAGLSDAAYRVAEGGLEALAIYRAKNLQSLIEDARSIFRITGTALSQRAKPLGSLTGHTTPRLILLGNEEEGLSKERLQSCDDLLMIPGAGSLQSLNVAQTAAILGYALQPKPAASSASRNLGPRDRQPPSRAERKGGVHPRSESGSNPKAPAPTTPSQKKRHSPKGSGPGTKTPSR